MAQVIRVFNEIHAVSAGLCGQRLAQLGGFDPKDCIAVQTAILEVTRNILRYAGRGCVVIKAIHEDDRDGLRISAIDFGPGIEDLTLVLQDGYSTGGGLGRGLPGARRLMDHFEIASWPGTGTSITMKKWKS
jgi:serine/threonine-protein kinase RsbT